MPLNLTVAAKEHGTHNQKSYFIVSPCWMIIIALAKATAAAAAMKQTLKKTL